MCKCSGLKLLLIDGVTLHSICCYIVWPDISGVDFQNHTYPFLPKGIIKEKRLEYDKMILLVPI